MAAPSTTVWGDKVNSKGRIGINVTTSTTNDKYTVTLDVWFWSKYSVSDSSNNLYYDIGSSASTDVGSVNIKTTSNTSWSEQNQIRIGGTTASYTRGTSTSTYSFYAKLSNVDYVGASMRASTSFTVPTLDKYTITYNANGGTGAPSSQTKWYNKNITISSTIPTRTGYTFVGWGKSSTTTSVSYNPGGGCGENANLTLYAIWRANTYTVTFNANGGTGAPANQSKTHGTALTLSSTKPTRTDYNFLGWSTSSTATTATYTAGGSYTANAAVTLYAVWQLAYTKPRINNLAVYRTWSDGSISEDGWAIRTKFSWATDKTVTSIKVEYKLTTASTWTTLSVSASGTSGTVDQTFTSGVALSAEYSYDIRVSVSDASGTTSLTKIISAKVYPIDIYNDGKGIAFLKPATTSGIVDIGGDTYVNGIQVTGNSLELKGHNTITTTDSDTVANWNAQKNASTHYYGIAGQLNEQPSTYGILVNYSTGSNLHQLWMQQPSGIMAHRGGNNNGWNGGWKTLLDSSNYGTYCVPKSGGTFSGYVIFSNAVNTIGYHRLHNDWHGFYANATNAQGNSNRKGWIGFDGTTNFNFQNGAGGNNVVNKAWTTSSDNRFKDNVEVIPDVFIDIWNELQPKVFKWNEKNFGNEELHFGLIAQDVISAFAKYGLNHADYGFVNSFTMQDDETEYFGIAYDEYHMLTALVLKKTNERLNSLQAQIDELKQLLLNK